MTDKTLPFQAMSEEQLSALLAKLNDDSGLREKLKGAADLDAAVAIAKDAGFDVSKADWLRHQARQTLELSDEQLNGMTGGYNSLIPLAQTIGEIALPAAAKKPLPAA